MRALVFLGAWAIGAGCGGDGQRVDFTPLPEALDALPASASDDLAVPAWPAADLATADLTTAHPGPGRFGATCSKNSDCDSQLCLDIMRCSKPCTNGSDCQPAADWSCGALPGVGNLCVCSLGGAEVCDGRDNDCDGLIDNGAFCSGGRICQQGQCTCPSGQLLCSGVCLDPASDTSNCGQCGRRCPTGASCQGGQCGCPPNQIVCGGACLDASGDRNNCGGCGVKCATGASCQNGRCACPSGQTLCGGACLATGADVNNCGACGHKCAAGASCQGGQCQCPSGQAVCGTKCTDISTDTANCGGCGVVCPVGPHVKQVACMSGVCAITDCDNVYDNCDNDITNGCERYVNSNAECGQCGHECPPDDTCSGGICWFP